MTPLPATAPLRRPTRSVLFVALVAAVTALATGPAPPQEQPPARSWQIPQGSEAQVLQWLGPLTDGAQLTPTWQVANVAVASDRLRLDLANGATHREAVVRLVGDPPHVAVDVAPDLPPDVRARVDAGVATLQAPGPFIAGAPTVRSAPLIPWRWLAAAYATLRFLALFVVGVWLVTLFRQLAPHERAIYLSLTLLAAALRLTLSPQTFLHELYHVDESLSLLSGQPGFFNGYAGPALYTALVPWTGFDPKPIFLINLIASTLTVPALARLAALLWRDPRAGWLAGLLLAASPVHLRWGAAEDQWILGAFWAVLALGLWLETLRAPSPMSRLLAVLTTVLALQTRPELMPLPAVLVLLAVTERASIRTWLRQPGTGWALLAGALASWPFGLLMAHRPPPPPGSLAHAGQWLHNNLWLDRQWTPLPIAVLLLLGLVLALRQRRFGVLLLAAAAILWVALPFAFYGSAGPFTQRTQLLSTAFGLAIAAGPLAAVTTLTPTWLAVLLTAALALVPVIDRRAAITQRFAQQAEWQFLRDQVPHLPPFARLLAPEGRAPDRFPIALLPLAHRPELVSQEQAWRAGQWPSPGPDLFYYQSMACWFADHDGRPPPDGLHPRCVAVREHYELEPVLVTVLPERGDAPLYHSRAGGFEVGFYRVVGRRSRAVPRPGD